MPKVPKPDFLNDTAPDPSPAPAPLVNDDAVSPITDETPAAISANDAPAPSEPPSNVVHVARLEEWHVTVEAESPVEWESFCLGQGVTPLFIELNDGRLQLMSAIEDEESYNAFVTALSSHEEFTVVRVKHEVQSLEPGETPLYFEAHVKFDGPYRKDLRGASRDLYRLKPQRWYVTKRGPGISVAKNVVIDGVETTVRWVHPPFTSNEVHGMYSNLNGTNVKVLETESEWVLIDTNPGLDDGWV